MRMIGLLGGMSWQSTAEYYRILNELVRERLGGLHSARLVLHSVDFAEIEVLQAEGRWDEAGAVLAAAARSLEAAGADFVVLCTNTMHKVAEPIQDAIGIPLLHLGDATADAVKGAGIRTVGLLGTRFTMAEEFYRGRMAQHGLTVLVPGDEDQRIVNDVIYQELCLGVVRPESREAYRRIIQRLIDDGAEGVILGCTEIELLVGPDDSAVPLFPTTRLHCESAVTTAFGPAAANRR
ncbi:aspartate/glutamate racemase family protein [Actinoplanes couchii]|uniref:Aspartate racemase n=1 Tax=Actinoplanes couchii TaxID=403638 RepID=A0ABQ3XGN0_9ACTN|nr:aspartate/glutamate racemase family protein [Actinoplanes couchii]MDR6320859.1 aspartate racemase [Actinoplanes couchii]GID57656.1 aspartate racemase [Actinoplanes couchii]